MSEDPVVEETRARIVERWHTIAVTALPSGWRNLHEDPSRTEEPQWLEACAAVLLQELRSEDHVTESRRADGARALQTRNVRREQPYETRAVFAAQRGGRLEPACELATYRRTFGLDESAGSRLESEPGA